MGVRAPVVVSSTSEAEEHGDLRIGRIVSRTYVEGPGPRAAIWLAGCRLRCAGCFNPHLWDRESGVRRDPADVAQTVADVPGIRGLTILGGEPFDQPRGLATLLEEISGRGLDVIAFTGYRWEHLRRRARGEPAVSRVLAAVDLLVDGPFLQHRIDVGRPWLGSVNQRYLPLTPRGVTLLPTARDSDAVEVTVGADGVVHVNGWLDPRAMKHLERLIVGPTII